MGRLERLSARAGVASRSAGLHLVAARRCGRARLGMDLVLSAGGSVCHSSEVVSLTSSSAGTPSAHGVNVD